MIAIDIGCVRMCLFFEKKLKFMVSDVLDYEVYNLYLSLNEVTSNNASEKKCMGFKVQLDLEALISIL